MTRATMTKIYAVVTDYGDNYMRIYEAFFKSEESAKACLMEQDEELREDYKDSDEGKPELSIDTIDVKGPVDNAIYTLTCDMGEGEEFAGVFYNTESKAKSDLWRIEHGIRRIGDPDVFSYIDDFEIERLEVLP